MDPHILVEGSYDANLINELKQKAHTVVDIYQNQLQELCKIQNPGGQATDSQLSDNSKTENIASGTWVFYPWSKTLLHIVNEDDLFALRTNRNKNLITKTEQEKLKDAVVGIAGMSVGAGIALSLSYSGISKTIKIADFDELDTTNLNRLHESLLSVGQKKTELAKQRITELDPFINVIDFSQGLDGSNIDSFFVKPNLTVVIDEIDDFKMKVQLRLKAKEYKVPLLMFTSLGDNILIDVERYDINQDLQPFHGLIGDVTQEILNNENLSQEDIKKYSVQLVGKQYIPKRAYESVMEMGKTLVGRPQLYSTIAVDGGLAAYVTREIILNNNPNSGRYYIKFANLIENKVSG